MKSVEAFLLGTVVGAAVASLWGRELAAYTADSTRGARAAAAESMRAAQAHAGRVGERVGSALRAAEAAIRPEGTTGTG